MANEVEVEVTSKDDTSKGFKSAERNAEQMGRKIDGIAKKAGQGMGKVGGKLTEGLSGAFKAGPAVALGAGVAVGAVLVGGITKALEKDAIKAKLGAQLGLAGSDAKKYGDAAADLYKSGWGESIQETADITKAAFENGLVSIKSSKDEIRKVGEQVAVYSELTGEDAVNSTRAVAQMIKTGLAKNATEAFDILTKGQQLGINKSEDLLDTFNEYGTQFRKLGLSGGDALGLINQMLKGGARDADTAADAVKEFGIRAVDGSKTTEDGFKSLGLNVEKTVAAFGKGGPAAKASFDQVLDALRTVKDPIERNRIGVELFGTKWEDLGAAIDKADLSTAAGSLGKVAGATQDVNDALSATPAAKIEGLKRKLTETFVDLFAKYALPTVTRFVDWLSGPGIFKIAEWALAGSQLVLDFADKFLGGLDVMLSGVQDWGKWILRSMAATMAPFNAGLAKSMWDAADDVDDWAKDSRASIDKARTKIHEWNTDIGNMKNEVKLKADKADLDSKLAKAKQALKDPNLTKTRKAQLKAEIAQLTRAVATAQSRIDSLHGKTVNVTTNIYRNLIETKIPGGSGVRVNGNWGGGAVMPGFAGGGNTGSRRRFLAGENGPEIVDLYGTTARVTPSGDSMRQLGAGGGGGGPVVLEFRNTDGGRYIDFLISEIARNIKGRGGNVVQILGGKAVIA